MEPLVLRCRILAPYVPLRATSSKSVPSVDIVYIVQWSVTKTEFRNHLIPFRFFTKKNSCFDTFIVSKQELTHFRFLLKKCYDFILKIIRFSDNPQEAPQ